MKQTNDVIVSYGRKHFHRHLKMYCKFLIVIFVIEIKSKNLYICYEENPSVIRQRQTSLNWVPDHVRPARQIILKERVTRVSILTICHLRSLPSIPGNWAMSSCFWFPRAILQCRPARTFLDLFSDLPEVILLNCWQPGASRVYPNCEIDTAVFIIGNVNSMKLFCA